MCRGLPSITKKHERDLQQYFKTIGETKIAGKTPQNEAACWMFRQGKSASNRQRYALAVVYYASKGAQWDINTNWMTPKHECSWYGVTCNAFRKIVELDLGYIELEGELRFVDFGCPLVFKATWNLYLCLSICIALPLILEGLIPRELGLLDGITDLDLHGNDLQGVLPHRILVGMNKIQYLRLQMNGLFGSIHKEMTRMKHLKELYLFGNFFAGSIPKQLSKLKQVEVIDLYANQLTGTVRISKTTKVAKTFQRIEY